jgi:hypothetical protein
MESAVMEIVRLGGKLMLLLPLNSRAIARRSKEPNTDEWIATTPASARAVGPVALPDAANAVAPHCPMASETTKTVSFFIQSLLACGASMWRRFAPFLKPIPKSGAVALAERICGEADRLDPRVGEATAFLAGLVGGLIFAGIILARPLVVALFSPRWGAVSYAGAIYASFAIMDF